MKVGVTPAYYLWLPQTLSYWLNNVDGDCVTAEEAAAKATTGILISDAEVERWAQRNGVLNGADTYDVLQLMTTAGFQQDGNTYNDGPATSVDFTDLPTLQNAIAQGPLKVTVAATQLENTVGTVNGWLGEGFSQDSSYDHNISAFGFGTVAQLLQFLGGTLPMGVDGTKPGIAVFTWDTIGVLDYQSFVNITSDASLRTPRP